MGGTDVALYDLLGKLFDLRVYQLLECVMTEYCFMDHPLNDLISMKPFRPDDSFAMILDPRGWSLIR